MLGETIIRVSVKLPSKIDVSKQDAKEVESELHNSAEAILARRWHLIEDKMP